MIKPYLYIKSSPNRGRGVFTKEAIPANTVIEIAPVVVLPVREVEAILATKLANYVYKWGESGRKLGVALGYGSNYNHSYNSNAKYSGDYRRNLLTIRTVKPIRKGSEIFVNYNCDPDDDTPIWFDVI